MYFYLKIPSVFIDSFLGTLDFHGGNLCIYPFCKNLYPRSSSARFRKKSRDIVLNGWLYG